MRSPRLCGPGPAKCRHLTTAAPPLHGRAPQGKPLRNRGQEKRVICITPPLRGSRQDEGAS
ncbi:MAG: hypothetical protein OXU61_08410, partial [Gammaproteobacteria bacterium]|nr:hypothetical protein [Gammaproteobacteria bacterium]